MGLRTTIILIVIAVLGTSIVYKYYSLTGEISDRDNVILKLRKTVSDTKLRLNTENGNVASLKETIRLNNEDIERKTIANKELKRKFEEWKAKPPKIKYVNKVVNKIITETKYVKGKCEDGLELNRKISNLKYENIGKDL